MNSYFSIYFILVLAYMYILLRNKDKILENTEIDSVLNEKYSTLFEIVELVSLLGISITLYNQKFYFLVFVFALAFIEHINQILLCYRQTLDSLQILTILMYVNSIFYSYSVKCNWVVYVFIIGILIHIISLVQGKSFTKVVCVNKKNHLQSS
jgi:hypothetical protein